ncbi:Uncharacterised protein [Streptococcus pneumoniae]|nr:Uncharacterised protein [Streptococcus pneumoniae]CVO50908.1 Uncharacterised protein [Streptococcus pneumoniae]CVQ52110.1 Uncharacterised protein [Streptococcus pneumoniae]CVQ77534.1 Uncharacterised protein [Streptococcus pneumoniae]CVW46958.1 Uncharacterised protein [Streptococcus pneumoniae]
MIDKVVRNLLLTFFFLTSIVDKNHKLFVNYTCQKEKDVLQCKQVKRKEERSYDVGTRVYTISDFLLF